MRVDSTNVTIMCVVHILTYYASTPFSLSLLLLSLTKGTGNQYVTMLCKVISINCFWKKKKTPYLAGGWIILHYMHTRVLDVNRTIYSFFKCEVKKKIVRVICGLYIGHTYTGLHLNKKKYVNYTSMLSASLAIPEFIVQIDKMFSFFFGMELNLP